MIVALAIEPNLLYSAPEVGRFGPLFGAPSGILGDVGGDEVLATSSERVQSSAASRWAARSHSASVGTSASRR